MGEEVDKQAKKGRTVRLMFQDEARFGRISDARRCWVPADIRPVVGCQLVREYTYAYAAVSPHDGIMDSLVLPEVNASLMPKSTTTFLHDPLGALNKAMAGPNYPKKATSAVISDPICLS